MIKRLGNMLVEKGLITRSQLREAVERARESGARVGEVLAAMGVVTEADILRALAEQFNLACLSGTDVRVEPRAAQQVPEATARRYRAVPIRMDEQGLVVAVADPLNVVVMDEIALATGLRVQPVLVTERELERLLQQAYPPGGAQAAVELPSAPEEEDAAAWRLREMVDEAPVVRLVHGMLDRAIADGASDIHIEPTADRVRVRYRVDGLLYEAMSQPLSLHAPLVSRLKVMSSLDISVRRQPQDGRFEIRDRHRNVDLRVATMPTIHGEKVAIRILDKSRTITRLEDVGLLPDVQEQYQRMITRPSGIILICGPTGSGKTTTLIATLHRLNSPELNIVTLEDPVEYEVPGTNQIQVNERTGITFASGLRSILRQDPNIIMVGEIRDRETAEIAIRAALTGHLVFSTVHTNDAAGAVTRLLDQGIEPFLVASSLVGTVGQRLARRLCRRCRQAYQLPADAPERLSLGLGDGPLEVYRAVGCPDCNGTGYRGRLALFELLAVSPSIRELVLRRADSVTLRKQAVREGMQVLAQDGVQKALQGLTSLGEVRRVTYTEG
ncbi:MAG: GspE/PulE family protein [Bacillota bacterium]